VTPELHEAWIRISDTGGRPLIVWRKNAGWHVRDMARLLKCDPADDTEKATANEAGATADADTASTANKDEPKEGTRKTKKDPDCSS
jgi:hypothetical protein